MVMSALGPKTDMCAATADVGCAPIANVLRGVTQKLLEGKGNNSMYRCDPQTKGVSLPSSSLVEKARSNLFLAGS
jgi:hypothetical protein